MASYKTTIIPFGEMGRDQRQKWTEFNELRKSVFMDTLGWELNSIAGQEIDEYDCAWAVYVLLEDVVTGRVVGGARMLRTDQESYLSQLDEFPTSYMIRDAFLGRLEGLPSSICFEAPPQSPDIWELTRMTGKGTVSIHVMRAVNKFLAERGAQSCIAMSSPLVYRLAQKMGYQPEAIGAMQSNSSGQFVAFQCHVLREQDTPNPAVAMGGN